MKKLLLSIGGLTAMVIPIATVVACGDKDSVKDTTLTFTSNANLFKAATFVDDQEANDEQLDTDSVEKVITETEDSELVSMVKSMINKDKIKLVIHYNDADLEVDAGVKLNESEKAVVTVNKVYITRIKADKVKGERKDYSPNTKISAFKKHVKDILTKLVDLAKQEGLTSADIKTAIKPTEE